MPDTDKELTEANIAEGYLYDLAANKQDWNLFIKELRVHIEAAKRVQPHTYMLNELIVYAERYAINRRSYANGSVADDILNLHRRGLLNEKTTGVLILDIEQAFRDDVIPYEDQKKKWREVLAQLKSPGKPNREKGQSDAGN